MILGMIQDKVYHKLSPKLSVSEQTILSSYNRVTVNSTFGIAAISGPGPHICVNTQQDIFSGMLVACRRFVAMILCLKRAPRPVPGLQLLSQSMAEWDEVAALLSEVSAGDPMGIS
ncbi:hypothetical protein VFPPC_17865 [Pochonia chlamydosporia 170]|uniref:Uncharacterized protein n=1 Tax=Pochonia chlamydosporia 170 TaxID=1380566 RepID=A0A219AQQ6_METCM|nr:hypothetical protein VFPPC_17865 [Pochonia chlamydosporia 170]OWT42942.1 hypothetical protein VFPPC_17865 [Pochonia chlamydosporia 170]